MMAAEAEKEAVLLVERLPAAQGYGVTWYFDDGRPMPMFVLNSDRARLAIAVLVEECLEAAR